MSAINWLAATTAELHHQRAAFPVATSAKSAAATLVLRLIAATVLVAFACAVAPSAAHAQTTIFSDNLNDLTGFNQNATQYLTTYPVSFGGSLNGTSTGNVAWGKTGDGALNSVEIDGVWWPGFYDGGSPTTLTTSLAISGANTLGVNYSVSFNLAPSCYSNGSQATSAASGDGIGLELVVGSNIVAQSSFLAADFNNSAGFDYLPYQTETLNYVGNGLGNPKLEFYCLNPGNGHFGGAIDDVVLQQLPGAPIPSFTWSGTAGSAWNTTTQNWVSTSNHQPASYTDGSIATFDDSVGSLGSTTIVISGSGVAPYQATFNNNAYNYTVQSSGGIGITGSASLTLAGSGSVTITGANTYTGNTNLNSGTLIVSSVNTSLGSSTLSFNGGTLKYANSAAGETINNAIQLLSGGTLNTNGNAVAIANPITGGGGLTKTGAGILTLNAANTYLGNTVVNGGTLSIIGGGQIYTNGATGSIQVGTGGMLQLDGWDYTGDPNVSEPPQSLGQLGFSNSFLVINGGTVEYVGGTNDGAPGNLYGGRPFTIGATGATLLADNGPGTTWHLVLDNRGGGFGIASAAGGLLNLAGSGNGEFDKVIPGTGGVAKAGFGMWTLTGSNTYTGGTTVNGGTLMIGGGGVLGNGTYSGAIVTNSDLIFGTSSHQTINGAISGSGALGQSGPGTLLLNGSNSYTGGTFISGGLLQFGTSAGSVPSAAPGSITISGGALAATGPAGYTSAAAWLSSGLIAASSSGALAIVQSDSSALNFGAAGRNHLSLGAAGAYTYSGLLTPGSNGYFLGGGGGTLTFSPQLLGANSLTVNGNVVLTASNNYSGTTNVTAGVLQLAKPAALYAGNTANWTAANISVAGGAGLAVNFGGSADFTAANVNTLLTNLSSVSGSGLQGGASFGFDTSNAVAPATYSNAIGDSINGSVAIAKLSGGTLVLAANNTYSGGTTLGAGVLQMAASGSLGSGSISFQGGTLQFGPGVTADVSAQIAPLASGQAAIVDTNGNNVTFSAPINGAGALTKAGQGTLTLTSQNSYTGVTIINGGALSVTGSAELYGNTGNLELPCQINAGGELIIQDFGYFNSANPDGSVPNLGHLDFPAANLVVNGGTIAFVNGDETHQLGRAFTIGALGATLETMGTGTRTIALMSGFPLASNGGVLTLTGDGTGVFGKIIPGTGGVTKSGTGLWTLTAANTYTGGTTISNGTLQVANANALGSGTVGVTVNGGMLDLAGQSATVPASLFLVNGSVVDSVGTGTLIAPNFNVQNGSISASLGGAASTLTKTTSGLVTLSGANTYGGGTTISAGTLALQAAGTLGSGVTTVTPGGMLDLSAFGSGGYNFNSGTLAGGRSGLPGTDINGNLNVNGLAVILASPSSTLTINGGLALNGATLGYNPGGRIAVGGGLTLTGTDYVAPTSFLSPGTYTLLTYSASGGLAGSLANLVAGGPYGSSARQTYIFGTSGGSAVTLSVTGLAGNLEWRGGTWNTNGNLSWYNLSTSAADTFYAGDFVTFDDTAGTANGNVVISGTSGSVLPGSVTVSNTAVNYTFSGVPIAGATNLTKSGPGNLTLSSSNTYSGGTNLHGGVLNANAGAALGTGALTVNGGTLNINAAQPVSSVTMSNGAVNASAVGALGTGPLTQSGGVLTAGAAQSISSVTLSGGLLNIGDPNALGSGTLTISGGTLANISGPAIVLGGNNAQNWNGSFTVAGTNSLNLGTGPVTLGVSPTITLGGGVVTVGGSIFDGGSGLGLTVAGPGTLNLVSSNSVFSGDTTVTGATLNLSAGMLYEGTTPAFIVAAVTVNGGGKLIIGGWGDGYDGATNGYPESGIGRTSFIPADLVIDNGAIVYTGANEANAATASMDRGFTIGAGGATFDAEGGTATWQVLGTRAGIGFVVKSSDSGTLTLTGSSNGIMGQVIPGAGGVIKSGPGVWSLTASNAYSGGTTVTGGTLQLGNNAALGTGGMTANHGTVDLAGFNPAIARLSGIAGTITNSGSGNSVLTVSQISATTFGGQLTDGATNTLGLALTGSGTLVLSGTNTYSGGTLVEAGTLMIASSAALADDSNLAVGTDVLTAFGSMAAPSGSMTTPAERSAPVPEPGTLTVLIAGVCAGLGAWRSKWRKERQARLTTRRS